MRTWRAALVAAVTLGCGGPAPPPPDLSPEDWALLHELSPYHVHEPELRAYHRCDLSGGGEPAMRRWAPFWAAWADYLDATWRADPPDVPRMWRAYCRARWAYQDIRRGALLGCRAVARPDLPDARLRPCGPAPPPAGDAGG